MKAIVTGGAGFIGSHLAEALAAEGANVHVIDNLSTGNPHSVPTHVKRHNIDTRSGEVKQFIVREQPDIVFHQAAQVDVQRSLTDPGYDADVNITGSVRIFEACRVAAVKKVIYASSCAVYGDLGKELIEEEDPVHPISFYGLSKLTPEAYLRILHQLYGLQYTVLRYANVYGPRQTPRGEGGVIAIFLDRIRNGMPVTVYGDGTQTRDFVYVKDVVRANLAAIRRGNGQIFNIGTSCVTSVNELVQLLGTIRGAEVSAVYKPERPGDIKHSCLNHHRANRQLGWKPYYDLFSGLQETYEYVIQSES